MHLCLRGSVASSQPSRVGAEPTATRSAFLIYSFADTGKTAFRITLVRKCAAFGSPRMR